MEKEIEIYKPKNFRKRQVLILTLGLVVPIIEILTKGNISRVSWTWIVVPIVIALLIVVALEFMRLMLFTRLLAIEVDVKSASQLVRKPKKNQDIFDKKWEALCCYFDGDFEGVFAISSYINEKGDKSFIFSQRDLEIKANLILGNYNKVLELIEQQNQIMNEVNPKSTINSSIYYESFKSFISGDYEKSISLLNTLLEDKQIAKQNNIKISIYHFLRMVYKELGNEEQVKKCTQEILKCDPRRLTFFTK